MYLNWLDLAENHSREPCSARSRFGTTPLSDSDSEPDLPILLCAGLAQYFRTILG